MENEVINLPDHTVDYHPLTIIINNLEGLQASIAQYVSLKPKFEYEKSCSRIGSTWTAKTQSKFIFDFYSSPKMGRFQILIRKLRGWN